MTKRSFFLWSGFGDAAFLAMRLEREGHDVVLYTEDPAARDVLRGYVKNRALRPDVPKNAVVIFDGTGHGTAGEKLRKAGHATIGGNPFDIELEEDRAAAEKIMREAGIATPETRRFRTLGDAEKFLGAHPGEWFFKASGADLPTALTTNGDEQTIARFIRYVRDEYRTIDEAILQKRISGCEVDVEGWFTGKGFAYPFNSTLEEKRFLAGNHGPRTGCEANVVWTWAAVTPPLAEPLEGLCELLEEHAYRGPLALNSIIDGKGVLHGLEFSARLGFDAFQAFTMLVDEGELGEQLYQFAHGDLEDFDMRHDVMAATLRVSIPPYPFEEEGLGDHVKAFPLDPLLVDGAEDGRVFLADVMEGDGGPVCAGRDGMLAVLGTVGDDIEDMRAALLEHAKLLEIPGLQFRIDPIDSFEDRVAKLRAHGMIDDGPPELVRDLESDDDSEDTADDDEKPGGAGEEAE